MRYKEIVEEIYESVIGEENSGRLATYIPELAKVNPENFGVHLP